MKKFLLMAAITSLTLPQLLSAQVANSTFKITYNSATCNYDVSMVVTSGSSASATDPSNARKMNTSQVAIVVPTGTSVTYLSATNPQTGSLDVATNVITLSSSAAPDWSPSLPAINDGSFTGKDVYAFVAPTSSTYMPVLTAGTEYKLFSVKIGTTACGNGVRLWNNNMIHSVFQPSGDPETVGVGRDFNNSFKLGTTGTTEKYDGNGVQNVTPPSPTVSSITRLVVSGNMRLTAAATLGSACAGPLTYAWSTTGTGTPITVNANPGLYGGNAATQTAFYAVTVKDANGCTASLNTVIALPVKLNSFDAAAKDCKTAITWATSEEKNADRFEVQRSAEGKEWYTIGSVKATNENGGSYSYTDKAPATGDNLYRLKMIDKSGAVLYSQVRTVKSDCAVKAEILVYPTDVSGDVFISLPTGSESAQVMLLNNLGQVVATNATGAGTKLQSFSMSALAAGQYMVRVVTETEAKTFKVIKH